MHSENWPRQGIYQRFKWLLGNVAREFVPARTAIQKIRTSHLFDRQYYLRENPDVAKAGIDPAFHYYQFGATEGRDPGPNFSTRAFQNQFPITFRKKHNPLLEYQRRLEKGPDGMLPTAWDKGVRVPIGSLVDKPSKADLGAIARHVGSMADKPLLSLVMPVYNSNTKFLIEAINSVRGQIYENWELCIANDASTDKAIAPLLDAFACADARIKVIHRNSNGHISLASNSAIAMATGQFIALLDHDDLLEPTALYEIAAQINANPNVDLLFSDEEVVDEFGTRRSHYFKSNYNIDLLLGQNAISHFGVYRTEVVKDIGGFRVGYEGSQDYDLALRFIAKSHPHRIVHIPTCLYGWRHSRSGKSFSSSHLEKCVLAARRAIQDFLDSEGQGAVVNPAPNSKQYSRVLRKLPDVRPIVSCIIPTRDQVPLLRKCVDGLLNKTNYAPLQVIIVDNDSSARETLVYLEELERTEGRVSVIKHAGEFNYARMNNRAAAIADGSIFAFINNDIEVIEPFWLDELVANAIRSDVGAVGAKLLYPNKTIQHAGVVVGLDGVAGHPFRGLPRSDPGYNSVAALTRQVSAVTGACLVVKKDAFLQVGGFDEKNLPVAYNDVDLCLKLQRAGYRNIYTPFAELIHHESASRGRDNTWRKQLRSRSEVNFMKSKWAAEIANDPFYNPNLSLEHSDFRLAAKSRRVKPWAKYL